jgi:hypothetical protein
MKKIIFVFIFTLFFLPTSAFALSSEVHITKDGKVKIEGVKVMQLAGQTIFTRLYWGDAFVRLTVKTGNNTVFYRATGEKTQLSEIAIDDILNLEGELEPGGSALIVIPTIVRNVSVEKEQLTLSGKVTSVDVGSGRFSMNSKSKGAVIVAVGTTTEFIKGSRAIDLSRIKVGDTIKQTSGDFDYKTKTLNARAVNVFVDMNTFKPKTFEGVISSIAGNTLPTSLSIKISGQIYTVYLNNNSSVLNKEKKATTLSRFEEGDKVRLYGAIREADELLIDAEVIRNMDL